MRRLLALFGFVLCLCDFAVSQTEVASLTGPVIDPSGAVVPSATVTLTNNDTQLSAGTKTNSTGNYSFPAVAPGHYTPKVVAQGFQGQVLQNLVLHVQDRVSEDVTLQIGSAGQIATVSSEAIPINTKNASVGKGEWRQASTIPVGASYTLDISPDGNYLFASATDGFIVIVDLRS